MSLSLQLVERVRREKPTIRELYLRSGITGSARIGTPADIADIMQEWFEAGACDGFNVTPATLPGGGEELHRPTRARRIDRTLPPARGVGVAPVIALDLADTGEHRPVQAVALGGRSVEGEEARSDVGERASRRLGV